MTQVLQRCSQNEFRPNAVKSWLSFFPTANINRQALQLHSHLPAPAPSALLGKVLFLVPTLPLSSCLCRHQRESRCEGSSCAGASPPGRTNAACEQSQEPLIMETRNQLRTDTADLLQFCCHLTARYFRFCSLFLPVTYNVISVLCVCKKC
jgi:hypothetical protein